MTEKMKIAMRGGGIASLCFAPALSQNPSYSIKIFEASPTLRDEGATIGLGSNAQEALALISPTLREALDEAGGTRMDPTVRVMMGTGSDSVTHVGDIRLAEALASPSQCTLSRERRFYRTGNTRPRALLNYNLRYKSLFGLCTAHAAWIS